MALPGIGDEVRATLGTQASVDLARRSFAQKRIVAAFVIAGLGIGDGRVVGRVA